MMKRSVFAIVGAMMFAVACGGSEDPAPSPSGCADEAKQAANGGAPCTSGVHTTDLGPDNIQKKH
jgi:hypothetical protein